jgi:uncharacterized protein
MLLRRQTLLQKICHNIDNYPVTLLLGPRQCGKTTLAREVFKAREGAFFDLEDPETPLKGETANLVLRDLKGLIVIDEIQRQPSLFSLLRVLADRIPLPARFLILGSASPQLVKGASESLAGRAAHIHMEGFDLGEVGAEQHDRLWVRGGLPRSFLADDENLSYEWRGNFIQALLERDMPQLGILVPAPVLRRFWLMLAHYHGNIWNASELARSMGTKQDTARRYLDILTGAFLTRQLTPWFENLGKRLVKSPKIYIRDSGILHSLLGLKTKLQVQSHPKLGFSWEGFALEQVIGLLGAEKDCYFYRTHGGAELDCLIVREGRKYGFEFKYDDAPRPAKSMHVAVADLGLEKLWIVHPGTQRYPLHARMDAVPLVQIAEAMKDAGIR